jgi:hypothetical protein
MRAGWRIWLVAAGMAAAAAQQGPPATPAPSEPPKALSIDSPLEERADTLNARMPEIPAGAIPPLEKGPERLRGLRWRMQYLFDRDEARMVLNDVLFASAQRGFAAALRLEKGREYREVLVTRDGGHNWQAVKVSGVPLTLFALDESRVWLVTSSGLFYSPEGGAQWEKRKRPSMNVLRVHFKDDLNGWAFGAGKTIWETGDGGRTWKKMPVSDKVQLRDDRTSFCCLEFATPKDGLLVGNSVPPQREIPRLPDWMTPERAMKRRLLPGSSVTLETRDGGRQWTPSVSSTFGVVTKLRLTPRWGVSVFAYGENFYFPAEVMEFDLSTGKSRTLFRRKDVNATDALVLSDGAVLVAGIEPRGLLRSSPVPGKLRIFYSPDRNQWYEMKVDYRAAGQRAFLSYVDGTHLWAATDEGAILRLGR